MWFTQADSSYSIFLFHAKTLRVEIKDAKPSLFRNPFAPLQIFASLRETIKVE
jgi:hypothetical protein